MTSLSEKYIKILELYKDNNLLEANRTTRGLLEQAKEEENHYFYAVGLNFLAAIQTALGNKSDALDFYFEAMIYAEKNHANEMLPVIYNNIGARYMDVLVYDKALIYLEKAKDIFDTLTDVKYTTQEVMDNRLFVTYVNLAICYTYTEQYEKSERYTFEVEKMRYGRHEDDIDFTCDFLHCRNQYAEGNMQYVKKHMDELIKGIEKLGDLHSYERNVTDMYDFLVELEDTDRLVKLMEIVENIASENDDLEMNFLACSLRTAFEKRYGTPEIYHENAAKLSELFIKKEAKQNHDRRDNMSLRLELKRVELERHDEEERQKRLLSEALSQANNANNAKSDFLSRMSHEIRTPLNAIIGYNSMILESFDDKDKLADYNNKLQIAATHLLSLVNDVLDVSAIASGHLKIEHKLFDLKEILMDISALFMQQVANKNITFTVKENKIINWMVIGDSLRTKQILLNLLSNAVKFTGEYGKINLRVNQTSAGEKKVITYFDVEDDGIGMTKEFLDRIFVPFEQQDASITRKYGGTGLGLSISYQLVSMMDGTIDVESEEGRGTLFTVMIPFEVSDKVQGQSVVDAEGEGTADGKKSRKTNRVKRSAADFDFSKIKALLVEDNSMNMEIAKHALKKVNMNVDTAENGRIAWEIFKESRPGTYQIIFMDIHMPEMDGYEATANIRNSNHQDARSIPILALTADAFNEEVTKILGAGMNGHVAKPIKTMELYETIEKIISL